MKRMTAVAAVLALFAGRAGAAMYMMDEAHFLKDGYRFSDNAWRDSKHEPAPQSVLAGYFAEDLLDSAAIIETERHDPKSAQALRDLADEVRAGKYEIRATRADRGTVSVFLKERKVESATLERLKSKEALVP